MIKTASKYVALLNKHMVIDDWQAVEILMAIVAAHKIPGEMLWVRLIGASGTGKTELLASTGALGDFCSRIESLTPSAIRRGYIPDGGEQLPTLLSRINGKLVITKELAPLLTSNRELKLEIFGLLRSVHDGELVADYGSKQGHIVQYASFDWILGSTRYVDRQSALDAQLGSRFIDLRWGTPLDQKAAVVKAICNKNNLHSIRQELAASMEAFVSSINIKTFKSAETPSLLSYTADMAHFVATFRTPVERDSKAKDIVLDIPEIELGTRVGQAFARIADGLALIGITDYKPYLLRLAFDCISPLRSKCIKGMLAGHQTEQALGDYMGVSHVTAHYTIKDLEYLGLCKEQLELVKGAA